MDTKDLTTELWREYELQGGSIYRIENPERLITREGGTTHRVVDADGIVHCVPAVGVNDTVLRWKTKPGNPFVSF